MSENSYVKNNIQLYILLRYLYFYDYLKKTSTITKTKNLLKFGQKHVFVGGTPL